MEKETIIAEVKTAVQVALLKAKDMHAVALDKNKNNYAYGIIAVAAILSGLGLKFFGGFFSPSWGYTLGMMVYQIVASVVGIYVMSIVAKSIFKGQAQHDAFFRVMAFGMIVTWLSIIPALSIVGGIWGLVIVFVVLKTIHKLTTGGAIGSILVSVLAMAIVGMILGSAMGALGLGGIGYGGMKIKGGDFGGSLGGANGFKMNVDTEDGQGSVNVDNGKMTITGPNGEKMDITIPTGN
jgi:hypothetical protein